jgi:uncharacterized protein YcbK (DUF882 family)
MDTVASSGRRRFLKLAAGVAVATTFAAPAIAAPRPPRRRSIAFHHLHTGEKVDLVYWAEGHYQRGAMRHIDWVLRDYRNGAVHHIDPKLLDLLAVMRHTLRTSAPFMVISAYRSPATNAMLCATTEGVAHNSLHLDGQAIDIRLPDRNLAAVHKVAMSMRAGGVGYYPASDFVHVDTGKVRYW